ITRDQTEHLIPNENLMINQVVNWSYSSKEVRVKAPVGVSYNSDLDLVERLLYQAVDETKRVLKQPRARVNIMGFGDNSVDFEVRFWIEDPEEGLSNIRSDVLKRVWQLFHEHGVEIPFPQRDLHLKQGQQLDRLIAALERGRSKGEDEAQ
ncbi:MAG: mechanosensitive ion channel protein, partial [Erythrobacter sp.]|nr:mechanosensitive ion channel protein [Erythrobacter sp.]